MTLGTVVLVGLLGAFGVLALLVVARLLRTMARGRGLARFQHAAADVAERLAREGNPLVRDLEDLRRRSVDAQVVADRLATATPALRSLGTQARDGLHPPKGLDPLATALAGEVTRALRSAELAQAGLDALMDGRGAREAEATTSLKRASLNLRNAIDEAARLATRIGTLRTSDLDRPGAVVGAISTGTLPTYGSSEDDLPIGS